MTSEEHDRAVRSLSAALVEQDRLSERYDAASGTAAELGAYVRLRAVGDLVAARGAWLSWIDDEGYRGLNAGPFELLAESDSRAGRAIKARSDLASRQVGRARLDAREVGDTDPRFTHLTGSRKNIGDLRQPPKARGNGARPRPGRSQARAVTAGSPRIEELQAEAGYHRERYDL